VSDNDVADVSLPSMQGFAEDEGRHLSNVFYLFFPYFSFSDLDGLSALTASDAPVDVFSTPPQLDGELITLTLLPRSRWQTLLNLEVIQA
jgi:U3 small nucleolar RNA-associated protein 21